MADRYLELVNSGIGRSVAGRLGLPRPAVLRRYSRAIRCWPATCSTVS